MIEVDSLGLQRQQMENNEWGESSKKLSPPRTLPLKSLRISEGKRSSPTSHWLPIGMILGLPAGPFGPRPKLLGGGLFPCQFFHTPALSSQTTKGVRYQELWVCRHPNKNRNVIYNMKYARKNRERKGGSCWTGLDLNQCSSNRSKNPSPDPGLAI
jgi:hypothetical protein